MPTPPSAPTPVTARNASSSCSTRPPRLFAERGYGATRIADICREAGVAKGLFYWYFPTKAELFTELVRVMRLRLRRAQAAAMDSDASALQRIVQGTEASVRVHGRERGLLRAARRRAHRPGVRRRVPARAPTCTSTTSAGSSSAASATGRSPTATRTCSSIGVLGAVSSFSNSYRSDRLDPTVSVDELARFVGRWVASAADADASADADRDPIQTRSSRVRSYPVTCMVTRRGARRVQRGALWAFVPVVGMLPFSPARPGRCSGSRSRSVFERRLLDVRRRLPRGRAVDVRAAVPGVRAHTDPRRAATDAGRSGGDRTDLDRRSPKRTGSRRAATSCAWSTPTR